MNLDKITIEKLVEEYDNLRYQEEELSAKKKVYSEEILKRMKNESEIVGDYIITKIKRYKFDLPIEKARELGISKIEEKLDQSKAKQLFLKGVDLPHTVSEYPLIKIQEEGGEQ